MSYLDILPDELLIYHIFSEFDITDIYKMMVISDNLKRVSQDMRLWNIKKKSMYFVPNIIHIYTKPIGLIEFVNSDGFRGPHMSNLIEHMKYMRLSENKNILLLISAENDSNKGVITKVSSNVRMMKEVLAYGISYEDLKNVYFINYDKLDKIYYIYNEPFIIKGSKITSRIFGYETSFYRGDLYAIPMDGKILLYDNEYNPIYGNDSYMPRDLVKSKLSDIPKDHIIE